MRRSRPCHSPSSWRVAPTCTRARRRRRRATRRPTTAATVLAIAQLAGEAAGVYDRTLSLFLVEHRLRSGPGPGPRRRPRSQVRKDVYGYDALAWALLANDRPAEADDAMTTALAFGTRDAKLLYHAGMIKAALGDDAACPRPC